MNKTAHCNLCFMDEMHKYMQHTKLVHSSVRINKLGACITYYINSSYFWNTVIL